ncbi:MAG: hypothetical protein ACYCOY_12175 [Metallibacterium sp.]
MESILQPDAVTLRARGVFKLAGAPRQSSEQLLHARTTDSKGVSDLCGCVRLAVKPIASTNNADVALRKSIIRTSSEVHNRRGDRHDFVSHRVAWVDYHRTRARNGR